MEGGGKNDNHMGASNGKNCGKCGMQMYMRKMRLPMRAVAEDGEALRRRLVRIFDHWHHMEPSSSNHTNLNHHALLNLNPCATILGMMVEHKSFS